MRLQRRAARMIVTNMAVGAVLLVAGCGGGSDTSGDGSAGSPTAATGAGAGAGIGAGAGTAAPAGGATTGTTTTTRPTPLVAVTTAGALVVLDSGSGQVLRTLRPSGVGGDQVALTPDGGTVYYEATTGCQHQIWRTAVSGGTPTLVAGTGSRPALDAGGTRLAYATQYLTCSPSSGGTAGYSVTIRTLAGGAEKRYPMHPGLVADGIPAPVTHLSWAPDGSRVLVSIAAAQDNEGWQLSSFAPASDPYYVGNGNGNAGVVSLPTGATDNDFYYEGIYEPGGNLFAVQQCCTGYPPKTMSVRMVEVTAGGQLVRTVAIGLTDRGHTSLAVDRTGRWLLYLSGTDLEVSAGGARPVRLATGIRAATW